MAMYLKTEALPNAKAMPMTNSSTVNSAGLRPMWKSTGPLIVCTCSWVWGYESRNRQIQLTHNTHQVTLCAPQRSDIQPPTARSTPPGKEKQAASSAALCRLKPYSCT
ncbi:hypothetical protein D3C87_1830630 [compost metagenome]